MSQVVHGTGAEAAFERWGRAVVRHRWAAVVGSLVATAFLAAWLPWLSIDNSLDGLLRPDDPTAQRHREFRERFDRDDRVVLGVVPTQVYSEAFLEKLRLFHLALEDEVPYVEKITSLLNARDTRGEADALIIEDLVEGWRDDWPSDFSVEVLRHRIQENPLYEGFLISEDGGLTTVTLKPFTYASVGDYDPLGEEAGDSTSTARPTFMTPHENQTLMAAVHRVVARFEGPDFRVYLGGALAVSDHVNRIMEEDASVSLSLTLFMVFALLLLLFRRLSGAIIPLMVMTLSVVGSVGIMVLLGIPATASVQTLPVLLLAVGVCDAVHLLTITYQQMESGVPKEKAIPYAVGHSGLPVVMTSLTTAVGLTSFLTAEVMPVFQLGIIAPIGVAMALLYSLILLPAALAILPLRPSSRAWLRPGEGLPGLLVRGGQYAARRPKSIVFAAVLLALVSLAGAVQVQFSHDVLRWFGENDRLRVSTQVLNDRLGGPVSLEVMLDTGRENGLHDPDVLRRIEAAGRWAESYSDGHVFVGKAVSLADFVKETHKALNEDRPEFLRVPDERALVAQELILFESGGGDDLAEMVDGQFRIARLSLRAPMVEASSYGPFIETVEANISRIMGPEVEVSTTGMTPVITATVTAVITSMARSYLFAIAVITPLMMLLLRNVRLGFISMAPNLIPVLAVLGMMGWCSIPLDYTTITIGAIIIGLSVDDTIHFMHKFQLYHIRSGNTQFAIRETLSTTGAALVFTSLVLAGGFFVTTGSSLVPTRTFGFLAGFACLIALAADVILGPALMTLCVPSTERGSGSTTEGGA